MRMPPRALLVITLVLGALSAAAQTEPAPPAPPPPATEEPPPVLSDAGSRTYERHDPLPEFNIYAPEGQASLRLRRMVRNALLETQIDYEFYNGDISAYLRYKYYARNYTYRIGVFDTIEFPNVGESSTQEFERVRGALLLVGVPRDYDDRFYWLLQGDALTFGDLRNVDNKQKNFYTKVGYQAGTQFDERLNGIVGETRGSITPVLTAFREIGPTRSSWAAALTQTTNVTGGEFDEVTGNIDYNIGDYRYTKFEFEGIRRFDVSRTSFVFTRLHLGTFFGYDEIPLRSDRPESERYSIPRHELFRLGGRQALRAIGDEDTTIGSQEAHLTNEFFTPIFRNRDYSWGPVHWNALYGILYAGAGAVAFTQSDIAKNERFVADVGVGFETQLGVRDDFDVLLSVLWATTVVSPECVETQPLRCEGLKGSKLRFSIRTVR